MDQLWNLRGSTKEWVLCPSRGGGCVSATPRPDLDASWSAWTAVQGPRCAPFPLEVVPDPLGDGPARSRKERQTFVCLIVRFNLFPYSQEHSPFSHNLLLTGRKLLKDFCFVLFFFLKSLRNLSMLSFHRIKVAVFTFI